MNFEKVFSEIYEKNKWGCTESKSGPGSRISVNEKLLKLLEDFVQNHKIKTVVDCGCGDFNWMKLFNFSLVKNYIGIDVVDNLIEVNNKKFSNNKITFIKKSIVDEEIPNCDLIICKDVLFHLNLNDASNALKNFKKSNSTFLISTSFTNYKNTDITTGGWRPINLETQPFNLGKPYLYWENIEDRHDSLSNKSIGIWKLK